MLNTDAEAKTELFHSCKFLRSSSFVEWGFENIYVQSLQIFRYIFALPSDEGARGNNVRGPGTTANPVNTQFYSI